MSNTTTPAVPTYLELISQDEKTVKIEALRIEAQRASIAVQTSIMELGSKIADVKMGIAAAQRRAPYSVKAEYDATKVLEELEAALAFAKKIKDTRFTDVTI